MEIYEILFWAGLVLWIGAGLGLSVIGLKNSAWFGPYRSPLSNLEPIEAKIAKIVGLLFFGGLILFVIGFKLK